MRTLWAGIRETDVLCHSHEGHDIVQQLRDGVEFKLSDNLVIRALKRNGILHGFGMAVVQTENPDVRISQETHRQYYWLVEGWLMGFGIGPVSCILMFEDDIDPVPDAPEVWK